MSRWHPNTLRCYCHDQDVCPAFEAECSEQADKEWWESLTQEEKDSYSRKLCNNCMNAFTPSDDDGEQDVCNDCVDYLDEWDQHSDTPF